MIDSRLKTVLNFVDGGKVADIGADHGYLSIELIRSGRAEAVMATEMNVCPFEAARKNISAAGLETAIDIRLGDGLKVLKAGEVDIICIAGMGGVLIKKILDDAPDVIKSARKLVLQPMKGAEKVRAWLAANSWQIADEDLAESAGFIYEIICAEKNPMPKTFKRENSPLKKKFWEQRVEKLKRVLSEMNKSPNARSSEKFAAIQAEIDYLAQKIHSCHSNSILPI